MGANRVRVDINTGLGNQEWLKNTVVAYKIIIQKTEQQEKNNPASHCTARHDLGIINKRNVAYIARMANH